MILSQGEDMRNVVISQSKRPGDMGCFHKLSAEEPVKDLSDWDIQEKIILLG
jgi:hypothetical protein